MMIRTLLILTVVIFFGVITTWKSFTGSVDKASAASDLDGEVTVFIHSMEIPSPDSTARIIPIAQGDPRIPLPGKPVIPKVPSTQAPLPKFPAEPAMPAELLQSQQLRASPSPLQSFPDTFEGRIGKLNFFSRTNALRPAPSTPPVMQMMGRLMAPPNTSPGPTLSIKQLQDYLLAQPGGREILEEAKRRKLRLSHHNMADDAVAFSFAHLLMPAEAQAAEGFKAVFTAKDPKNSGLTFTGIWLFDPFKPVLDAGIHVGGPQSKALAVFRVDVPRAGLYWVTVRAYASNVKATLMKAGTVVKQFYYGSGANFYDYWAPVDLAAGSHNFYWYVDQGTAEFIEVSVQEDL